MAAIVPDDALLARMEQLLGAGGINVTVRLFVNSYTPDRYATPASFTEADFTGYAAYHGSGWGAPAVDPSGTAYSVSPAITWTMGTPGTGNTVYGWYATVTTYSGVRLVAAELFALPIPLTLAGQTIERQITLTDRRAA